MEEVFDESVSQLLRGERPEFMSYDEFCIKRKMVKAFLKRKRKGSHLYISKEYVEETDPKTGNKERVIKVYQPYKKNKDDN